MSAVVRLPRAANPSIAAMRCEECGAAPMIFVPCGPVVRAFCGPNCAATWGVQPWAGVAPAQRAGWRNRAELEAMG